MLRTLCCRLTYSKSGILTEVPPSIFFKECSWVRSLSMFGFLLRFFFFRSSLRAFPAEILSFLDILDLAKFAARLNWYTISLTGLRSLTSCRRERKAQDISLRATLKTTRKSERTFLYFVIFSGTVVSSAFVILSARALLLRSLMCCRKGLKKYIFFTVSHSGFHPPFEFKTTLISCHCGIFTLSDVSDYRFEYSPLMGSKEP